jgi:hypothetical protein
MKQTIYHGSEFILKNPEYGKGVRNNDYGRGFYCTESLELAKEWACAKGTNGYANLYEIELDDLEILHLGSNNYNILNWLALLAENRTYWQKGSISEEAKEYLHAHFLIDIKKYDLIIGYRADDSYFSFAQDFVSNTISLKQLSEAMRLGKLGEQVVIKSPKGFEAIKYMDSEPASKDEYYIKKAARDREARKEYRTSIKKRADINDLFILDIMREGIKNGDARLS